MNVKSQASNLQQNLQNQSSEIPFFISAGADGQIRIYEYNPYISKENEP